jgi:hypothetical protein
MPTKILFAINDQGSNYKTRDRKKTSTPIKPLGNQALFA